MTKSKLSIFLTHYKWPVIIGSILAVLAISFIWIIIVGVQSFASMESFYRKSTMAQMAFGLYQGIFHVIIFASIYMAFHYYFFFGGGITKLGKKKVKPEEVNVRWSDLIGMETAKKEVWEVVRLIKDRSIVNQRGGKIIKGVLMLGPPGCGKTYMAKAIATETRLPFLHANGSEFKGMFVGIGSSRVKSLFKEARSLSELKGGCIIFIDEIDTIARSRVVPNGMGAGMDHNATVNQLLAEMDGLSTGEDNIIILAATNTNEDELDSALMRPGRFDRKIHVGLPGLIDRKAIISYYLNKVRFDDEKIDIDKFARLTVNNTPADIENIIRESDLIATRNKKQKIGWEEINEARERISLGIKQQITLSEKDKEIAAYHEAGHALITYLLVPTSDVFKATIIPRKENAGVTWVVEKEERFIPDKQLLLSKIKMLLSGYASEKIKFGSTSAGVGDDLRKANELAELMVTTWGMGTSGPSGLKSSNTSFNHISDRDKEDIINNCLKEINEVLRKEKDILEDIAQQLLLEEELDYDELQEIFDNHGKTRLTYSTSDEKREKTITWNDIIGMEEVKEEAKEIVNLIKDRVLVKKVGGQIIKGLLMFGPPGCGKTYLASTIAQEAGVPFIAKSGSEFVEMFVGVGASRIRQLFQEAREQALSKGGCIIFIDEIDALCARRSQDLGFGGTREHNQTLNQFLVELDGLKEKDVQYNIVVIGATNMDELHIDPAILRPGRFDRKIYIDLPTFEERKKIFEYYLKKVAYNREEIDTEKFAGITQGSSPADISNLIKESALLAARNNKPQIGLTEMDEARERITLGLKRKLKISDQELKATAYHEVGHIIVGYFSGKKEFPFKVSIIPRKGTLGVAWYASKDDHIGGDKNSLLGDIKTALAGYAAEQIKLGVTTTGVTSDFRSAMKIAEAMIWQLGMSKNGFIGDFNSVKDNLSDTMKTKLNEETQNILQECLKEATRILESKIKLFDYLTAELLKKEELTQLELTNIFNEHQTNGDISSHNV
ncbi:MAG: AAA family ATPase [Candidatus Omnitrophica bacterium]|nr:AAA family ATPase [Candidatus Omnitrophota bacterium]